MLDHHKEKLIQDDQFTKREKFEFERLGVKEKPTFNTKI